jgi:hypothetical protein
MSYELRYLEAWKPRISEAWIKIRDKYIRKRRDLEKSLGYESGV